MNEQPSEWVGIFFAIIVFMVFLYHARQTFLHGPHINYLERDLFNIGYVEADNINVVVKNSKNINSYDIQLYNDCVDALYAIGMKKSQAKAKTKEVFESHNPKSIQEFLMLALKQ